MKYRTGFVTNSSSVSFYVGRKGEKRLTQDDVFGMLKECWNDYFDCVEKLIRHILASEGEVRRLIRVGNEMEIWGEDIYGGGLEGRTLNWMVCNQIYVYFDDFGSEKDDIIKPLEEQFGIGFDEIEVLTPYDLEKNQVIRRPWLAARTYEEAIKLEIDRDDIDIFVLEDEKYAADVAAFKKDEELCQWDLQKEALSMDFDLQLGLSNLDILDDEIRKDCENCQVIVETWDSNIPMGVYNRIKARSLGSVYHGC